MTTETVGQVASVLSRFHGCNESGWLEWMASGIQAAKNDLNLPEYPFLSKEIAFFNQVVGGLASYKAIVP